MHYAKIIFKHFFIPHDTYEWKFPRYQKSLANCMQDFVLYLCFNLNFTCLSILANFICVCLVMETCAFEILGLTENLCILVLTMNETRLAAVVNPWVRLRYHVFPLTPNNRNVFTMTDFYYHTFKSTYMFAFPKTCWLNSRQKTK